MKALREPKDEAQLVDVIREAVDTNTSLAVTGRGTKEGLGRPVDAASRLCLRRFSGITYYEPGELVMEAGAGTPLGDIEAALEENGQELAFEPPDYGPLLGGGGDGGTIGGIFSCNLSGPRRPFAGAARDHILAMRGVSGRGELFASGGRVVKNVTGYDMSKLVTGSYGTLAVLSRVTFKVLPKAPRLRTVLLFGQRADEALGAYGLAADGRWEISGAAHIGAKGAARSGVDYVSGAGRAVTALRLEGQPGAVSERAASLRAMFSEISETEELHSHNSRTLWREIANGALLPPPADNARTLWRLGLAPSDIMLVADRILKLFPGEIQLDWAGGLAFLALDPPAEVSIEDMAVKMRALAASCGGNVTLFGARADIRARVPVFQPEAEALAALTRRIKENFDPRGVLNPGRMFEGV